MSIISTIKSLLFEAFDTTPMISFKCEVPGYEVGQPVKRAVDIKPDWMIDQQKEATHHGTHKFSACPGMHDLYKTGYIIPAWEDFEIIVTESTFKIQIGRGTTFPCLPHQPLSYHVVKDIIALDEGMTGHAIKFPSPWKAFTKPGYSALVMPAMYHSPFLRDLFVYPGINDYDTFHHLNLMVTPVKPMHIKIYAGTPLLQVIPYKREIITAEVGLASAKDIALANFTYRTSAPGFYRKWLYKKKTTDIKYI